MKGCFFGRKPAAETELLLRALDTSDLMELAALYGEARDHFRNPDLMDAINDRMTAVVSQMGAPHVEVQPGSPNFDGSAAYEAHLDALERQDCSVDPRGCWRVRCQLSKKCEAPNE